MDDNAGRKTQAKDEKPARTGSSNPQKRLEMIRVQREKRVDAHKQFKHVKK